MAASSTIDPRSGGVVVSPYDDNRHPTLTLYGGYGHGKTLCALRFAPRAVVLTPAPGNLQPAVDFVGSYPKEIRVNTVDEARTEVHKLPKGSVVILDDGTVLGDRSRIAFERRGWKGYDLWGALWASMHMLREEAASRGITLVGTYHEQPRYTHEGVHFPGGPKFGSRAVTPLFPHISQLVTRTGVVAAQPPEWGGYFTVDPGLAQSWGTKDRYSVCWDRTPMNLSAILWTARERGHDIALPSRPPGCEWMDEAMVGVADGLASGAFPNPAVAAQAVRQHYGPRASGRDPRIPLQWAWSDGVALARVRMRGNPFLDAFAPSPAAPIMAGSSAQSNETPTPEPRTVPRGH